MRLTILYNGPRPMPPAEFHYVEMFAGARFHKEGVHCVKGLGKNLCFKKGKTFDLKKCGGHTILPEMLSLHRLDYILFL